MPAILVPYTAQCPSGPTDIDLEADGIGRGNSAGAALSAARSEADTKLSIGVTCAAGCNAAKVEQLEPEWDTERPTYKPWGSGIECKVKRGKKVRVTCQKSGQQMGTAMQCRGVDVRSWYALVELANQETAQHRDVLNVFADAFEKLLLVSRDITVEKIATYPDLKLLEPFLSVYDKASANAVRILRDEIRDASDDKMAQLVFALRYAGFPEEMVALVPYLNASASVVPIEAKEDGSKKVKDSIKDTIKKWGNTWWIGPILDAINEALDIFRGGKGKGG